MACTTQFYQAMIFGLLIIARHITPLSSPKNRNRRLHKLPGKWIQVHALALNCGHEKTSDCECLSWAIDQVNPNGYHHIPVKPQWVFRCLFCGQTTNHGTLMLALGQLTKGSKRKTCPLGSKYQ